MNSSTVFFGDGAEGLGSECGILLKIYKQDTLPVKRDAARKRGGGGGEKERVFDSSKWESITLTVPLEEKEKSVRKQQQFGSCVSFAFSVAVGK